VFHTAHVALPDLRFQKFVGDDQRPDSIASVTAASGDGLIGCSIKAVSRAED
jgi:hypothetical protein